MLGAGAGQHDARRRTHIPSSTAGSRPIHRDTRALSISLITPLSMSTMTERAWSRRGRGRAGCVALWRARPRRCPQPEGDAGLGAAPSSAPRAHAANAAALTPTLTDRMSPVPSPTGRFLCAGAVRGWGGGATRAVGAWHWRRAATGSRRDVQTPQLAAWQAPARPPGKHAARHLEPPTVAAGSARPRCGRTCRHRGPWSNLASTLVKVAHRAACNLRRSPPPVRLGKRQRLTWRMHRRTRPLGCGLHALAAPVPRTEVRSGSHTAPPARSRSHVAWWRYARGPLSTLQACLHRASAPAGQVRPSSAQRTLRFDAPTSQTHSTGTSIPVRHRSGASARRDTD